jgi:imidazolonepropionase-like amidohydrolase
MRTLRSWIPVAVGLILFLSGAARARGQDQPEIVAARALFRANLEAIRRRDRSGYLATYLDSPNLVRTGPGGPLLGFEEFAKAAGENWPDTFEAGDLQLVSVRPGVVYGTYRYRVRYGAEEQSGISERLFLRTPQGWRIAVTSAFPAGSGVPPPPRALVGGMLLDGTGARPVAGATVLLRGGRIDCAGQDCPVPPGVEKVDAGGLWIVPGLVDAHVHFSQTGWADGRPDAFDVRERHPYEGVAARLEAEPERFLRSYLCSGVTSVFDVGGYPWTFSLARRNRGSTGGPSVSAAGPLLSTLDFWLNLPGERQFLFLRDPEAARQGVRYLAARGADAVKVWYIVTPQRSAEDAAPSVAAAGEEARRAGLPLIVHATGLAEAKEALRAGAHLLVHGVNDQPVDQEFLALAKQSGTIYCPTLTVLDGYRRLAEDFLARRVPEVDDPNRCVDRGTLERIAETATLPVPGGIEATYRKRLESVARLGRIGRENLMRVSRADIPVAMGTDAGNPLTLHGPSVYAEMEAMQEAGLSPTQVLIASTRGGSLALRRDKEVGTVEKGKAADLLLVAGDPAADIANLRKIRYVVKGGVVRSIEELSAAVAAAGDVKR